MIIRRIMVICLVSETMIQFDFRTVPDTTDTTVLYYLRKIMILKDSAILPSCICLFHVMET